MMSTPLGRLFALGATLLLFSAPTILHPQRAAAQSDPNLDKISSAPIPPPEARILAPGNPPLTQEMVDRFRLLIEWALEVQTTQEQQETLKQCMIAGWKVGDRTTVENTVKLVQAQKLIEGRPDAERDLLRQQVQPSILASLRKQANDPATKWILDIYEAAHQPLVPGEPPLTRQVSDAYLEVLFFMRSEVLGEPHFTLNKQAQDLFVAPMKEVWTKSDAERRKHFAGMPMLWAALRVEWSKLPEEQRSDYRKKWRNYLQVMAPDLLKTAARPVQPQQARKMSSEEAYQRAMAELQSRHNAYTFMSNMATMNHVTMMNSISNIGNSGWHYEYRYR